MVYNVVIRLAVTLIVKYFKQVRTVFFFLVSFYHLQLAKVSLIVKLSVIALSTAPPHGGVKNASLCLASDEAVHF